SDMTTTSEYSEEALSRNMKDLISVSESFYDHSDDEEGIKEFPLLELPDHLISLVFSFMNFDERRSLRVNERLDKIEQNGEYYEEELSLYFQRKSMTFEYSDFELPIKGEEGKRAIDELKRLAKNTTFGEISYSVVIDYEYDSDDSNMDGWVDDEFYNSDEEEEELHGTPKPQDDYPPGVEELFTVLCEMRAKCLKAHESMNDRRLLSFLQNKPIIKSSAVSRGITDKALLLVFMMMRDGGVDARRVELEIGKQLKKSFLAITEAGKFQRLQNTHGHLSLLDGNFEIEVKEVYVRDYSDKWYMPACIRDQPPEPTTYHLRFTLHDKKKDWEKRKEELARYYTPI
ncbi:hypothetical protein PFISCL1PPCAC_19157, partial [Pristionchus fissidentatus]